MLKNQIILVKFNKINYNKIKVKQVKVIQMLKHKYNQNYKNKENLIKL